MSTPAPEIRTVAQRLGLTGAEPLPIVLAALDEALAERADSPTEGAVLVDAELLAELQSDAERGRHIARDTLLAAAVRDGKITPGSLATWRSNYDADPRATTAKLATLQRNAIPVAPIGCGDQGEESEATASLYGSLFGMPNF